MRTGQIHAQRPRKALPIAWVIFSIMARHRQVQARGLRVLVVLLLMVSAFASIAGCSANHDLDAARDQIERQKKEIEKLKSRPGLQPGVDASSRGSALPSQPPSGPSSDNGSAIRENASNVDLASKVRLIANIYLRGHASELLKEYNQNYTLTSYEISDITATPRLVWPYQVQVVLDGTMPADEYDQSNRKSITSFAEYPVLAVNPETGQVSLASSGLR